MISVTGLNLNHTKTNPLYYDKNSWCTTASTKSTLSTITLDASPHCLVPGVAHVKPKTATLKVGGAMKNNQKQNVEHFLWWTQWKKLFILLSWYFSDKLSICIKYMKLSLKPVLERFSEVTQNRAYNSISNINN